MTPDLDAAMTYLAALDPSDDRFTFQYFRDTERSDVRPRHSHTRLVDVADMLAKMNAAGAGIFVTVNRTDGRGRSAANVTALRSVFIDCDRPRARSLALPPSMSVQTSPMRGHHYWLLAPGEPLDAFRGAQEALADYYNTDATVTDLCRVLRLPGFRNMKHEPFPVRLVRCNAAKRYTIAEILAAHGIEAVRTGDGCTPPRTIRNRSCAEIAYRRWTRQAPLTVGHRNRVAFRLAVEGFQAGLDPDAIVREVQAYCERAGIVAEAAAVLRSARRATTRPCRHSSPIAEDGAGESTPAK